MTALIKRYRRQLAYLFFGGCTTLINLSLYYVLTRLAGVPLDPANVAALIISIIFAYVVNRLFVFENRASGFRGVCAEVGRFFVARAFTLALDEGVLSLSSHVFHLPDLPVKIALQIVVIVLNYVLSRFVVFRKNRG